MSNRRIDFIQFLARYALYLVVPGFWFAYIGGIAPWIGGAAGFGAAVLLGLPVIMAPRRKPAPRPSLEDLLADG